MTVVSIYRWEYLISGIIENQSVIASIWRLMPIIPMFEKYILCYEITGTYNNCHI